MAFFDSLSSEVMMVVLVFIYFALGYFAGFIRLHLLIPGFSRGLSNFPRFRVRFEGFSRKPEPVSSVQVAGRQECELPAFNISPSPLRQGVIMSANYETGELIVPLPPVAQVQKSEPVRKILNIDFEQE
jgi:hypothetical protein